MQKSRALLDGCRFYNTLVFFFRFGYESGPPGSSESNTGLTTASGSSGADLNAVMDGRPLSSLSSNGQYPASATNTQTNSE